MSQIRSQNTKPERAVRSILHKSGFRFSLNKSTLPGKPDIVLPKYRAIVFVHGCFWHGHKGCKYAGTPKSNSLFWKNKFAYNSKRDKKNIRKLRGLGWKVLVVWQCQLLKKNKLAVTLAEKIRRML